MEKWIKQEVLRVPKTKDQIAHLSSHKIVTNVQGVNKTVNKYTKLRKGYSADELFRTGYEEVFDIYVLENRRPQVGEYWTFDNKFIYQYSDIDVDSPTVMGLLDIAKTVVISSDRTLDLPDFSESFYTRMSKVDNFLEETTHTLVKYKGVYSDFDDTVPCHWELDLKRDGTVSTKKVETSWTRETLPDLENIYKRIKVVEGHLKEDSPLIAEELDHQLKGLKEWLEQNW